MSTLNVRDQALLQFALALTADDAMKLQLQIQQARAAGLSEAELQSTIELVQQSARINLEQRLQRDRQLLPTAAPAAPSAGSTSPLAGLIGEASKGPLGTVAPAKIGAAMSMLMDLMASPHTVSKPDGAKAANDPDTDR